MDDMICIGGPCAGRTIRVRPGAAEARILLPSGAVAEYHIMQMRVEGEPLKLLVPAGTGAKAAMTELLDWYGGQKVRG